jgi:antibiotic biosynthesis monooxygenase (ABM) superfamily enzyme
MAWQNWPVPEPSVPNPGGATVVITHRVREGKVDDYSRWLDEIAPISRASPGVLDWQLVRPVPGLTTTYTVIIRFDTRDNLERWIRSPDRAALIEKVRPLLVRGDDYTIRTGLEFLFTPEGAASQAPVRWKQFVLTWSAIFPLAFATPWLVAPALEVIGIRDSPALTTLAVTAVVVFLMIYLVMPRYTRLVRRWLFD